MKLKKYAFMLSGVILILIFSICSNLPSHAQDNPNTITFDNKSGEPATVKLVGPTGQTVEVPQGQNRTVNVAAGNYYILVRYGSKAGQYTYSKGDPFTVEQTATQYSAISITLHKVVDGNYPTHPTSSEEFNKATTFQTSSTNRTTIKKRDNRLIEGFIKGKIVISSEVIPSAESKFKNTIVGIVVEGKDISSIDKNGVRIIDDSSVSRANFIPHPGASFIPHFFCVKF